MVGILENQEVGALVLLMIAVCAAAACILILKRRIIRKKQVSLRRAAYAENTAGDRPEAETFGNEVCDDFSDVTPADEKHWFHIIESVIYVHTDERMD